MTTPAQTSVQRDIEEAGELLRQFYAPCDANDTRPLWLLEEVLTRQQRALERLSMQAEELMAQVERQERINAGRERRLLNVEWATA